MSLLRWALLFLVVALVAALFGLTDLAAGAANIARVLFFLFLVLCAAQFVLGLTVFKPAA
jgi:uncharacterized membrane protein YtjA (UPF0391 family)